MTSTTEGSTTLQLLNFTLSSTVPVQYRFIPGSVTETDFNTSTPNPVSTSSISTAIVNGTEVRKGQPFSNGTGYYIIDEEAEGGLSELQTLFLACIATFLPLIISLLAAFGIRVLWRKYRRCRNYNNYDGAILKKDDQCEGPIPSVSSHCQQMKCSETQISIAEDVETCSNAPISTTTNGPQSLRTNNHHPVNTNGSIITMTLKNNHLIVETEERNDIQEDSRETKMTYSPSARDGVFVVEVQQGGKRSPGSGGPYLCVEAVASGSTSDQCALVHNPPDRFSDEDTLEEYDEAEYYVETSSPATNGTETMSSLRCQLQTGLCQSDRSISSTNQTYTYGNQQGYCSGSFGYPLYNGYIDDDDDDHDEPVPKSSKKDCHKPKIISEIYKSNSVIKASFEVLDELSCDNSGPVKHPSFERSNSREVGSSFERTPNQLNTSQTDQQNRAGSIMTNDATEKQFDEEQRRLGNSKTSVEPAMQRKLEQTSTTAMSDRQLPNNNINGLESCQIIQNDPIGNSSNVAVVNNNNTTENCLGVAEVA